LPVVSSIFLTSPWTASPCAYAAGSDTIAANIAVASV